MKQTCLNDINNINLFEQYKYLKLIVSYVNWYLLYLSENKWLYVKPLIVV